MDFYRDFYGFSGLAPDAPERAPENLDPKTGMLGLTPAVVFMTVSKAKRNREDVYRLLLCLRSHLPNDICSNNVLLLV